MKRLTGMLLLIFALANCQSDRGSDMVINEEMAQSLEMAPSQPRPKAEAGRTDNNQAVFEVQRKIIKNGSMAIEVEQLRSAKTYTDSLVKVYDGYYANEDYNNTDYRQAYELAIRIPAEDFESFIQDLEQTGGKITYKNINAQDVTQEFIDLETRLENKRSYLSRYRELLDQAKSVQDILAIQEKIRVLEEEIESTMARLKYLNNQVNFSTLQLSLMVTKDPGLSRRQINFSKRLIQSLENGWYGFLSFLLFMIRLWPFWILFVLISVAWRNWRRKRKGRKENKKGSGT